MLFAQLSTTSTSQYRKMYRKYFPACHVDGPIEPAVPYAHLVIRGAVPAKCAECHLLFEGGCTRHIEIVGDYLHLDHGPCGIDGPTDPVIYEDPFISGKVEIPRKCSDCRCLAHKRIYGFVCTKDYEKWGDFYRGLDRGAWEPDVVYLQLPLPKITTKALSAAVFANDQIAFIREHRRINPGLAIDEAKKDFVLLKSKVDAQASRVRSEPGP
jgi:hypothetical protein